MRNYTTWEFLKKWGVWNTCDACGNFHSRLNRNLDNIYQVSLISL